MSADPYWTDHHYDGHNFLIKADEPFSKWDGYCQYILQYRSLFGSISTPDTVEAIQPPMDAVRAVPAGSRSKALSRRTKVIPPKSCESPLEAVTQPLQTILCPSCKLPVQRTGKRGRPRTMHSECR